MVELKIDDALKLLDKVEKKIIEKKIIEAVANNKETIKIEL